MAPSHSTPQQVSKTIDHIITLLDSIDNKVLAAYHDYVAMQVRKKDYDYSLNNQYALLHHIYAIKVVLQTERRDRAIATTLRDNYTRERTTNDT
jgi:hypothetical protein